MTDTQKKSHKDSKQMANKDPKQMMQGVKDTLKKAGGKGGAATVMGTAAGVAVGAAVGGLAGAALSDQKTRQELGHKLEKVSKAAADTMDRLSEESPDITVPTSKSASKLDGDI